MIIYFASWKVDKLNYNQLSTGIKVKSPNAIPKLSNSHAKQDVSHFFKAIFNIPSSTDFIDLKANLKGVNDTFGIVL